jgi:hypothetical protein
MTNWTKYDYLCTDCDALIEITACVDKVLDPACICGGLGVLVLLGEYDGNAPLFEPVIDTIEMLDEFKNQAGIAIDSLDVMKVTPPQVVKINSNPYN